jgi:signal transduction histidine kinase
MDEREGTVQTAAAELEVARVTIDSLQAEVHTAHEAVAQLREELASERVRATEASDVAGSADRERHALGERLEKLAHQLETAVAENADLNRRLQDAEARRQLELADDQGRAQLDDLLRVTQERLAGQTEKLIAAEDRAKELEADLATRIEHIEVVEADLRTHQMSEALKEKRRNEHETAEASAAAVDAGEPMEDRRAATPFTKELSLDAKKTLSRMMGITQILKHKRDAKDQAQLIKQLTAYARRLDHTVSDLADADRLARGNVELQIKRSDVEALLRRVVEESGVANDHEVRVDADTLVIGVDALRTEQILSGLLRASSDRTPTGKQISVRLQQFEGGVLFSVEDPEPSSDASVSPVVRRFAEMQGGWAKVESRDGGGSAFRVYLPDAAPLDEAATDLRILVDAQQADVWDNSAEQILVQELHRLAELPED